MSVADSPFPFINPRKMHPRVISGYVKPSASSDIIRITLFMLSFIQTFDEDDVVDDAVDDDRARWTRKKRENRGELGERERETGIETAPSPI